MNKHQKIAFGFAALLAFAYLVVWTTQLSGLGLVLVLALTVALLTLPFTWRLIIGTIKVVGSVIRLIGHGTGSLGDWVTSRSNAGLKALSSPKPAYSRSAPGWDELATDRSDKLTLDTMFSN
jgi:hypothetical protein